MLTNAQILYHARMLREAYWVYGLPVELNPWVRMRNGNARWLTRFDNRTLYILGTDDLEDWQQNVDVGLGSAFGRHRGARKHADLIMEAMGDRIQTFDTIVGHSLGGTVAQEIALRLESRVRVVTFGAFGLWRNKPNHEQRNAVEHCRVTHDGDPVRIAHVGGYHAETQRVRVGRSWLRSAARIVIGMLVAIVTRRADRIAGAFAQFHTMEAYVDGLERLAAKGRDR